MRNFNLEMKKAKKINLCFLIIGLSGYEVEIYSGMFYFSVK